MRSSSPVSAFQSLALPSLLVVTTVFPSAENSPEKTTLAWPSMRWICSPVCASQIVASPPKLVVRMR